jgi:hypothetical protein
VQVESHEDGSATVLLDPDEFLAFANCLNETLEALPDWEFSMRVGVDRSVVERMSAEARA